MCIDILYGTVLVEDLRTPYIVEDFSVLLAGRQAQLSLTHFTLSKSMLSGILEAF